MRKRVESSALTEVSGVLEGLSEAVGAVEDDLLSCLVVLGEPRAQQIVDAWVDQVVDLVRAVDEVTGQHLTTLARVSRRDQRPTDQQPVEADLVERTTTDIEQR